MLNYRLATKGACAKEMFIPKISGVSGRFNEYQACMQFSEHRSGDVADVNHNQEAARATKGQIEL